MPTPSRHGRRRPAPQVFELQDRFRWNIPRLAATIPRVKSCLSLLFVLLVLTVVVGTAGALFYLSYTTEFSRKDKAATSATPPAATPAPAPAAPRPAPTPGR